MEMPLQICSSSSIGQLFTLSFAPAPTHVSAAFHSFDFMDDLSSKVGASFSTGASAVGGLQPVLEQLNRGLATFRMVVAGGMSWKSAEGTGVVTSSDNNVSSEDLSLAQGEGERIANIAAALKAASGGGSSNSSVVAPPGIDIPIVVCIITSVVAPIGWGSTWYAAVSANLTQAQ